MFEVFKVMAEKLSSCHMDVVQKLQEIVKDLSKYLEEQKLKHKQVWSMQLHNRTNLCENIIIITQPIRLEGFETNHICYFLT